MPCQTMDLEVALRQAAIDSGSSEMKMFSTSVAIQLRTGGNLADLMDRLSQVIRERMRLARRVLTAQTQFSKQVLAFVTFALLSLLNPKYMGPLYTTTLGQMMLAGGMRVAADRHVGDEPDGDDTAVGRRGEARLSGRVRHE